MKFKIYQKFTQENGILLSSNILAYLESNIENVDVLENLVAEYNQRNGSKNADLNLIKNILESFHQTKKTSNFYKIRNQEYQRTDFLKKYKFLKEKIENTVVPIYLIVEGEKSTIFGCYYKNKKGEEVLEDDGDTVQLSMKIYTGDMFLCENMFVAMSGVLKNNFFEVEEIFLPKIEKSIAESKKLVAKDSNALFFSDFEINSNNTKILVEICEYLSPSIIFLMGILTSDKATQINYDILFSEFKSSSKKLKVIPTIFLVAHENDLFPSYLPKNINETDKYSHIKVITNPSVVDFKDASIGIIRDDVFNAKKKGKFFGKDYIGSFVSSYLSQYSFNPFGLPNLGIQAIPDIFVVGQKFYPFINNINDVFFVSCPDFSEEQSFALYDIEKNSVQLKSYKNLLN